MLAGTGWDIGRASCRSPSSMADMPFGPTSEVSSSWMWTGGGIEIIRREYAKHNVMVFPCFIEPQETAGWYREEITGPESYDGMNIRISGLGAKVLTKLGASTQLVPGSETYLALERGRVDAADFAIPTVDEALGFYEIAKYNYFPAGTSPQAGSPSSSTRTSGTATAMMSKRRSTWLARPPFSTRSIASRPSRRK